MLIKVFVTAFGILFSSLAIAETVWIDVRSALEHKFSSIEGDARITHSEILSAVSKDYADKETEIYLYCRSGGRAEKAKSELIQAGYTNVQNVGSIDDARKARGLIETSESSE